MFQVIALFSVSLMLVLGSGCQTSKKKAEEVPIDVSADPEVSSKTMSFDPMGSDSGKIDGLKTINFEYDKASLTGEAQEELAENANWMKVNSNITLQIEGHCDERGSVEYNLSLGERRAKTVKNHLVSLGIDSGRINTISYGKEKLLVQGDSEYYHAQNRRANFVPLP